MELNKETTTDVIHGSLVAVVGEQNVRLSAVTKRQDQVLSCMSDELCELWKIVKDLQGGNGRYQGEGST